MNRGRRMDRTKLRARLEHAVEWMTGECGRKPPRIKLLGDECRIIGYDLHGDTITLSIGSPGARLRDHLENLSEAVIRRSGVRNGSKGVHARYDPTRVATMVGDYLKYGRAKRPLYKLDGQAARGALGIRRNGAR